MEIRIAESFTAVPAAEWNALVEKTNPFMRHEFLAALESTGCIGRGAAWQPLLFLAYDTRLVAAVPAFVRSDSYGEYIFDWAWANAYAQAGIAYYPKLTIAAPFTPATGRRLLGDASTATQTALLSAVIGETEKRGMSGVHVLCETRDEQRLLSHHAFLPRLTHQYHWLNRGFADFDDYLGSLRAHRRKEIRRERRKVLETELEIRTLSGDQITERDILAMYAFYTETYARKWGSPYLNRETFLELHRTMRSCLVLVLAYDGRKPVAGSIAFRAADRLYGRYWGALAYYPFLHFELCIYRLIDYAIDHKVQLFEAGAQGEHKFARGFSAMPIFSSHRLLHPQGAAAIEEFLRHERRRTARTIRAYRAASPNKDEPDYLPEPEDR